MLVDRTTETISHFLGLFALKVEQERLRDSYEEFTAERRQVDLTPVEPVAPRVDTDHKLRKSDSGPREPANPEVRESLLLDVPRWPGPEAPQEVAVGPFPDRPGDISAEVPELVVLGPPEPSLREAGVPGSILTITQQVARLHDNDVIGEGPFRDVSVHAAELAEWAEVAATLHAPAGLGRAEIPTIETALELHAAMKAFAPEVPAGVEVYTSLGPAVPQKIVNGVAVEEVPDWRDLLPAAHRDKEKTATGFEDWELPEGYRPNPDAPEGHSIMAGGNLLVNEARISVSYVDAPVIAVGGAWISLAIVSQVAMVSNRDEGLSIGETGATSVYQIVEVEAASKSAPWSVQRPGAENDPPTRISVEMVDGDLLVSNHIEQIIELLDNDAFGMSIMAANAAYILGANIVVNATSLVTAGFGYDLIIVGGNFISMNTIHQSLVLLDDDRVEVGAVAEAPVMASLDTDTARATEGNAVTAEGISGGIAKPAPAEEKAEEESAADPAPDNLLVNKALLKTVGLDTPAEMTAGMADILGIPIEDLETLREKLLSDPSLAGLEQARVLKISGDLIVSNTVKQTIFASDRDDIFVKGAAPPDLDIVAGQNAMLNAAAVSFWGVDSTVMAQDGVYSDLLIHQARLVDEPETSDPGLVNEAVAFLMDGADMTVADKATVAETALGAAADAYDLMQSSLT